MRAISLATLVLALLAAVRLTADPVPHGMAAAPSTSPAAAAAPAVHATTEADLALVRGLRPSWTRSAWDAPPIAGLRMRWCAAQDECPGDRSR